MTYSMDKEANKQNATSPSPFMSLHEQLIYKLAALDSALQSGFRRLDEKMDRFQADLHDNQIETNDRINRLENDVNARFLLKRGRIDALEKRINSIDTIEQRVGAITQLEKKVEAIENWKTAMVAKVSGIGVVMFAIWAVFGDIIKTAIGTNI